ncbi:MAG: nucleotide exchange factor GrpE [Deltaproteobacteria bacterium]|jgi:molecular chaperone GrpE|nr:nucleotide exchange factor GrpE [Deltaproteobacteria bacterium]
MSLDTDIDEGQELAQEGNMEEAKAGDNPATDADPDFYVEDDPVGAPGDDPGEPLEGAQGGDAPAPGEGPQPEEAAGPTADQAPPDPAAEAALWKDKYLRALADQENVRRRAEKQVDDTRKYAVERVLLEMIPVLDNLNLALSYADPADQAVKNLSVGVGMTVKDFLERLSPFGFKELVAAKGDSFDPNFHEAVGSGPEPGLPEGAISSMVKRGYLLHDRLLRPVIVNLVRNPPAAGDEAPGEGPGGEA